jgi:hypothetical protein
MRNGLVTAKINEFDTQTIARNPRRTTTLHFGYWMLLIRIWKKMPEQTKGRQMWFFHEKWPSND